MVPVVSDTVCTRGGMIVPCLTFFHCGSILVALSQERQSHSILSTSATLHRVDTQGPVAVCHSVSRQWNYQCGHVPM
jgi:hypothetical protein